MNANTNPPLTSSAVEQLRSLIESAAATDPPLREWELSLACGHRIRYRQHASLHGPDSPTWPCANCGHRRRLLGSTPVDKLRERAWRLREAQVEHRHALNDVARLNRRLSRAERRVAAARASLLRLQNDVESFGGAAAARSEFDVIDELTQQRPA
ncbi:hypothetical protein GCM10027421_28240 [Microbacterium shaanxiense]